MTSSKQLEIQFEDPSPQKWSHPLKEDVFAGFTNKENPTIHKTGSLFSPLLFGKFFDPSDAFPLWEFEADVLLPSSGSSGLQRSVNWYETDSDYVMKAEIPGDDGVRVSVEKGKILEISGQQKESRKKEWRSRHWWEHGYVRRIELPEQADWRKSEAYLKNNDQVLEIKISKIPADSDTTKEN